MGLAFIGDNIMSAAAGIIHSKTREMKPNALQTAPPLPSAVHASRHQSAPALAKPAEPKPDEPKPDEPKQSIEVMLAQQFKYRVLASLEKINKYEMDKIHFYAKTGDSVAIFDLGRCCARGIHCQRDDKRAALYFKIAADKGYAPAMFNLGLFLFKTNSTEAVALFQKAAKAGYVKAQHFLGIAFLQNHGVVPCSGNLKTAYNFFKIANANGEEKSKHYLGICLRFFRTYGVHIPKDLELSLDDQFFESYYTTTAQNQSQFACTPVSELKTMSPAEIQAMEKFVNSAKANQKPPLKLASVKFNLARCYFKGFNVKKNFTLAVKYCTEAAKLNFPPAQELLGNYHKTLASYYRKKAATDTEQHQQYIKKAVESEELALKYFAEAADNGYIPAQYQLALCYKDNIGSASPINPRLAFTWFMRAALHEHKEAEQMVAWCHANHFGIPYDLQSEKKRPKIIAKKSTSTAHKPREPERSAERAEEPQPEAVLAAKSTGAQHADKRRKYR